MKHSPEDLFVASISACHMLWYLHLCTDVGIVVTKYTDRATGTMIETGHGGGRFTEVTLYPEVIITDPAKIELEVELNKKANELCFIANSCNFPIHHRPTVKTENEL
jgi:organic hydroperoxide reductase OsmC/OhrA